MASIAQHESQSLRAADLASTLCLATDLGMGFPFEHGLQATLTTMRLCEAMEVDSTTRMQAYYVSLLAYTGCTAESADNVGTVDGSRAEHIIPYIWGSLPEQLRGLLRAIPEPDASALAALGQRAARLPAAARSLPDHQRAYCDVASSMASRLGLPASVSEAFHHLTDRWDGAGILRRGKGESIPLPVRIMWVARDATLLSDAWGTDRAATALRARAGKGHDPDVVDVLLARINDLLTRASGPVWDDVLAAEPGPHHRIEDDQVDLAVAAIGDFADLLSPWLSGHSSGVADLAGRAAKYLGLPESDVTKSRRAALVHDLGRVGVDAYVWSKLAPLTTDEQERIRLHPYYTERLLARSGALGPLAEPAVCHHERLDGSGYHRGLPASMLSGPARIVAAADCYRALTQPRPHRRAWAPGRAAEVLVEATAAGSLDPDAVGAVLAAAGQPVGPLTRPAGLTRREAQVLGLLARGFATKQCARALGISVKTADHHVQHAYRKAGVSSRAGATLFAMQHGLVAWGELPIGDRPTDP
jgi:HD-GYP domain-containing protein (c-di-GMP phosphodiesterase class II)